MTTTTTPRPVTGPSRTPFRPIEVFGPARDAEELIGAARVSTTTRLTGLTWFGVEQLKEIGRRNGIVPITSATTCTIGLSAGELRKQLLDLKTEHLNGGERGQAQACSTVIRKLNRYLAVQP
jgi:hypothetical protein